MTTHSAPHRPTLDDLDPESAAIDAPFAAAERRPIRAEFRARGGQTYPLDDGLWLHRWTAGPQKGQPTLDRTAIRTLLERGPIEIVDPPGRLPFARFTRAGLDALRRMARDRRTLPPDPYAHRLAELDAKLDAKLDLHRPGGDEDTRPILSPLATFRATPPHCVTLRSG